VPPFGLQVLHRPRRVESTGSGAALASFGKPKTTPSARFKPARRRMPNFKMQRGILTGRYQQSCLFGLSFCS
jgi:hypothetical protein